MAARYWVGGSGTWDSSSTANWSATSGGASGASVPTSSDIAIFDGNSGAGTVSLSGTLVCSYINTKAAFTGTLSFGTTTLTTSDSNYGLLDQTSTCTYALGTCSWSTAGDMVFRATNTVTTGASTITMTSTTPSFYGDGFTFGQLTLTNTSMTTARIGAQQLSGLQVRGSAFAYTSYISIASNITIGTLNLINGTSQQRRVALVSSVLGTPRTLTVTTCTSAGYTDFRDIAVTGAAAPLTGSYLGDCGGNSGITFPAPKTSYYVGTLNSFQTDNNAWSNTSTGAGNNIYYPLPQDTAVITDFAPPAFSYIAFGAISSPTNVGTLDCSARTTYFSMTASLNLYGSYIGSSNANPTLTANAYPRSAVTITCASRGFDTFRVSAFGSGAVTFSDAFSAQFLYLDNGSLTATANVSIQYLTATTSTTRSLNFGPGTWSISGDIAYDETSLTISGTGTISMTSASAKTFQGNNIQTWPTLDQGGAGALTITGSNKFKGLTNSYGATAATTIKFEGGTTNEFDEISLYGSAGKLCTLTSTNTTPITLKKGSSWRVGPDSINAGNNTGLLFMAGNGNYLSVSYVNAIPFAGGDMMLLFGF